MKKFYVLIAFLSLLNSNVFPQEKKITIRTGAGYYSDLMGMYDGPIFWLEAGYKFKTGFNLNSRLSMSTVDWMINDGFFKDYKTMAVRQMFDVTFSKPIKLKGRHYLEPGLGFKLKREYSFYPDLDIQNVDQETIIYSRYSEIFYEIGFSLNLDYYYQFDSGFILGFRADTNVIWALGFEGLTLSPLFGFRF